MDDSSGSGCYECDESSSGSEAAAALDVDIEEGDRCCGGRPSSLCSDVQVLDERTIVDELGSVARRTSELLNLTTSAACRVLRHFKWDYSRLAQDYFDHSEALLSQLGIQMGQQLPFYKIQVTKKNPMTCPLCIEEFPKQDSSRQVDFWAVTPCKHCLCEDCWREMLCSAIRMGRSCANTTCPIAAPCGKLGVVPCKTHVDEKMFEKFVPPPLYEKLRYYVVRSFVDTNPTIRWCPSPGCERAIRCTDATRTIVPCLCGFSCCFRCSDESHAPATCEQMKEWKLREVGESDNLSYITVNTKPCPTCKTPIERNEGCNHMTCTKCQSEGRTADWCWVCGQSWDFKGKHGNQWYDCPFKGDKEVMERQKLSASKGSELFKYVHYYEGYARHEQIRRLQIRKDKDKAEEHRVKLLSRNPGIDADFIVNAAEALIQARTYLKFSYVYAYYLDEDSKAFFNWKVQETEKVVTEFSNMLEDLYRWSGSMERMAREDAPWTRSQIMDKSALLKHRLNDVMGGIEYIRQAGSQPH